MAQQKGNNPLNGTIGNMTYYRSRDGYLAREKGSLNAARIANDPAFARTRENGAEFGRAGTAGKLLRTSLRSLLLKVADGRMLARLTKEMMRVIKADSTSERGLRNVIDGEAGLLEGFEFNGNSNLSSTLFASYSATVNRVTGMLEVDIPAFIPRNLVTAPSGATHFKLVSAGAEIDFENQSYVVETDSSGELPWDMNATAALQLQHQVTANSIHPLFLVLGIEFYQEVNGKMYTLSNGAFNALALVKVDS